MCKILIPILAVLTLQEAATLMAQPASPVAPAAINPDVQYVLGADSQPQAGVPEGKVMDFQMETSKTYPGMTRKWSLYLPPGYDGTKPCALMVFQDGAGFASRKGAWRVPVVLDNLIHRKELPMMAAIFVSSGWTS